MKIKPLTKEQIIISIDRLTRFKEPEIKYLRVFKEIILNNLIEPKFKKSVVDNLSNEEIRDYAEFVINTSLGMILGRNLSKDYSINKKLIEYEHSIFKFGKDVELLLDNRISYLDAVELLHETSAENLEYLKYLAGQKYKNCVYPVKALFLCEGITEEILLPEFAKICHYSFSDNGVYILSAGGKNQVVKYFYNYCDCLNIPIFVLLDSDASENYEQILPKLRKQDKIHILKSGEFEDLLTKELIIKTLKYTTENISLFINNIDDYSSHSEFLEEFYKHRGMHDFKKADFAQSVKENIKDISDISDEISEIFEELKQFELSS